MPELAREPPAVLLIVPELKLAPEPRLRLAPAPIFKPLPLASCRPSAFPFVPRVTLTVLVPSKIQAFVEASGVPLVQLPATLQEPVPSLQVVEGPTNLPHWAPACPAANERDSISMSRKGKAQDAIPKERWERIAGLAIKEKTEHFMGPPQPSSDKF